MADCASNGLRPAVPVMAAVFLFFASVGMTLPVLPLHVHDRLGFGPFVIGLVAGCQFAAALSRVSGRAGWPIATVRSGQSAWG